MQAHSSSRPPTKASPQLKTRGHLELRGAIRPATAPAPYASSPPKKARSITALPASLLQSCRKYSSYRSSGDRYNSEAYPEPRSARDDPEENRKPDSLSCGRPQSCGSEESI